MIAANHGPCDETGCTEPAIYRVRASKRCKAHKGKDIVFAPFLGQQEKFFQRRERTVFFGGAGGGGKSLCLMMKFGQQLEMEHRRAALRKKQGKRYQSMAWGVYFRRTTPDFKQAVQRSREFFEALDPAAYYNDNTHCWTFPSCGNAVFEFAHMEHEKDRFKYKSREYSYIAFDELTEFTELQFEYMDTRLRTADPELDPYLQICAASNPDGEGLIWVREKFIEPVPPETVMVIPTELKDGRVIEYDQIFIPAKLSDNPLLMESGKYEASLSNKRVEVREAILEGNWWIAAGAFLGGTWDQTMHVCENFDLPPGFERSSFRSGDWGINKPSSIGWWYIDSDAGLTCFAHLRTVGLTVDKVAEKMRAIEARYDLWDEDTSQSKLNFARNPLDSACFSNGGAIGSPTIAKDFAKLGFRWKPANKKQGSRYQGASQIIKRMTTGIPAAFEGATHPMERERPMVRFMRCCVSPIKTLPVLRADPHNAEDVDTDSDDHDWDMLMYACLERPVILEAGDDDDEEIEAEDRYFDRKRTTRAGLAEGPWTQN